MLKSQLSCHFRRPSLNCASTSRFAYELNLLLKVLRYAIVNCRESNIWLSLGGFQEKGSDDAHLRNTHVLIDDAGKIKSTYSKMHL